MKKSDSPLFECRKCDGKGYIVTNKCLVFQRETCPDCDGRGTHSTFKGKYKPKKIRNT